MLVVPKKFAFQIFQSLFSDPWFECRNTVEEGATEFEIPEVVELHNYAMKHIKEKKAIQNKPIWNMSCAVMLPLKQKFNLAAATQQPSFELTCRTLSQKLVSCLKDRFKCRPLLCRSMTIRGKLAA